MEREERKIGLEEALASVNEQAERMEALTEQLKSGGCDPEVVDEIDHTTRHWASAMRDYVAAFWKSRIKRD